MKSALFAATLALGLTTPAAAAPGFVTGQGTGTLFLELNGDNALDINLALPNYQIGYSSFGSYHEDGYDTSFVNDFNSIVLGYDLYAYAFSAPYVATPHSEVKGQGYFENGIVASISNPTSMVQHVVANISTSLSLMLQAEQPGDLTSGTIGYTILGSGPQGSPFSLSYSNALAPSGTGGNLTHSTSDSFGLDLAPGASYSFSVQDFGASFFLRAQAVPEPSTWIMMILGFGLTGYAMRRARRKAFARVHSVR